MAACGCGRQNVCSARSSASPRERASCWVPPSLGTARQCPRFAPWAADQLCRKAPSSWTCRLGCPADVWHERTVAFQTQPLAPSVANTTSRSLRDRLSSPAPRLSSIHRGLTDYFLHPLFTVPPSIHRFTLVSPFHPRSPPSLHQGLNPRRHVLETHAHLGAAATQPRGRPTEQPPRARSQASQSALPLPACRSCADPNECQRVQRDTACAPRAI